MPYTEEQRQSRREAKKRYFEKTYNEAPLIECACGCGGQIKSKDKYGRDKQYENGHNGRKYEDPTQYKREWNHRNRRKRTNGKILYARKRKRKAIEIKNSECNKCGLKYNGENGIVFQFHHKNPKDKKFLLSFNGMDRHKWEDILLEIDKCEMLCANCHFIEHTKITVSKKQEKIREYKRWAISLIGIKCEACDIQLNDTNLNMFQFHHRDKNEKTINISRMYYINKDKTKEEIKKCSLLCANCHFILHNEKF